MPNEPYQQPQKQPASPLDYVQTQPQAQQPPYAQGVPQQLSGGQKAAFFFLGFLLTVPGILATSMMNLGKPYRSEATKFAVIGAVSLVVLNILLLMGSCALGVAAISAAGSSYYSY